MKRCGNNGQDTERVSVELGKGSCFRPPEGALGLFCISGTLWLTDGRGGDDILLEAGSSASLAPGRIWICQCMGDTASRLELEVP